jgi:hypothetical protein
LYSLTYALAKYLASLLSQLVGHSDHRIRNSETFVQKLQSVCLKETDILVSFDVVSLFTKVPLDDTLQLLSRQFHKQTVDLIRHMLTTTYFHLDGSFYHQINGVAVGSPLTPVVANCYVEHFEQQAVSSAIKKPAWWFRFVDDTFVVWPHGKDELQEFLRHLNSIHPNFTFTMEVEQNKVLPFLDVLVSRRPDGSLGHSVYRKPIHTDLYLHARVRAPPSTEMGGINYISPTF